MFSRRINSYGDYKESLRTCGGFSLSGMSKRMANNMNYFEQIVFPPIPKVESGSVEEENIIPFDCILGNLLDLKYWFEYTAEGTKFMVRCPTCGKVYCYSRLGRRTTAHDIEPGIKDNPKFFTEQWIAECPNKKEHPTILNGMRGLT